jgi:molecular chaperone DnaK (HSP70)
MTNNSDDEIIVGIDLGTTNSCVCYWKDNNLIVIPDEKGNKTIPSYVGYTNINKYVGLEAKNQSIINANNVYYEVKRLIGRKFNDPEVLKEKNLLSYKIIGDENNNIRLLSTLLINNNKLEDRDYKVFTPEEISAQVINKLKHMAQDYLKRKITKAVITIPARFTDAQRQATLDASKIAGLDCVRMIHEPTAAAMAYGLTNRKLKPDELLNIIVYDFGGGTLDVSVVEISTNTEGENIFTVLGSAGNTHLGGADFDNRLCSFSISRFKKQYNITKLDDLPAVSLQKLKQSCETAKKILSSKNKAYIAVKDFYDNKDMFFYITRQEFEVICGDLLLLCLKPIDDILNVCDLDIKNINEIILVGGMTRMPMITDRLKQRFKITPNNSLNPDEAVAAGAAIQGYILTHNNNPFSESVTLLDVTPLSLGVETCGGIMDVLIPRNTVIPYTIEKLYTTDTDYATTIDIRIYEGERQMTSDNIFIGEFELRNITEAPRGVPEILVSFNIDLNGIITVTATEKESNSSSSIIVNSNKGGLSQEEIKNLIEEARELEARDELERVRKMRHYQIDDICSNVITNINNKNFKLSEHDKELIKKDIETTFKWLKEKKYYERDENELETILNNIKKRYGVLIIRGKLEDDNEIKDAKSEDHKTTNIYQEDEDSHIAQEKVFNIIEIEELGLVGLSSPEVTELKELRKSLNDLCYQIFDIIDNPSFIITDEHKKELKDFIDDALLWICSIDKPSKIDYKQKIDEINDACDKILLDYNDSIFKQDDLYNIKTKKEELETLCLTLHIMLSENSLPIKTKQKEELNNILNENLKRIYEETITEEECEIKIININNICNDISLKMSGINIDRVSVINSNAIITQDNNISNYEGTNIEELLRQKQNDEIEQIMIDSLEQN